MKKSYTLCEFACPLHEKCARYLPEIDKLTTDHFSHSPYDTIKGSCGFFEPYSEESESDTLPLTNRQIDILIDRALKEKDNAGNEDKA